MFIFQKQAAKIQKIRKRFLFHLFARHNAVASGGDAGSHPPHYADGNLVEEVERDVNTIIDLQRCILLATTRKTDHTPCMRIFPE